MKPGRQRELIILMVFAFTEGLLTNMLRTVVPLHALDMGASTAVTGILLSAPEAVQVLARIPAGSIATWAGRRLTFIGAFAAGVVALVILGLAGSPLWLVPAQLLWGVSSSLFWPSLWAYLTEVVPARMQAAAVGRGLAISGVGVLLGPMAGGVLFDWIGGRGTYAASLLLVAALIWLAWYVPGPLRPQGGPVSVGWSSWVTAFQLLRRDAIGTAVGWSFLAATLDAAAMTFLPLHLYGFGATGTVIGLLIAARKVAMTLARFLFDRIAERVNLAVGIIIGMAVDLAAMLAAALSGSIAAVGVLVACGGMGNGLIEPSCKLLVARATARPQRAIGIALEGTFLSLGRSAGPMAIGLAGSALSLVGAFLVLAAGVTVSGVALWVRGGIARAARVHHGD